MDGTRLRAAWQPGALQVACATALVLLIQINMPVPAVGMVYASPS